MLSDKLAKIGRALVGGNLPSIAKEVFSHHELRNLLIAKVLDLVNKECNELCRKKKDPSPFRKIAIEKIPLFTWDIFADCFKSLAPTTFKFASIIVCHSDKRNEFKKGVRHIPTICMALAMLLKERNREMVGLQCVISVALFASQVQKKVRLHVVIHGYNYLLLFFFCEKKEGFNKTKSPQRNNQLQCNAKACRSYQQAK